MFFNKPGQYNICIISWLPMIVIAIILSIGCFFIGRWTTHDASPEIIILQHEVAELRNSINENKEDINKLDLDRLFYEKHLIPHSRVLSERLVLLTIIMNENFAAIQAKKPQDTIFIERNWKINRMPKYLNFTKEDTAWLIKFLNKDSQP